MKRVSSERTFRLCFFCLSRSWGGLELMHMKLARALGTRGHTVSVIAPPDSPLFNACLDAGIGVIPLSRRLKYLDVPVSLFLKSFFREKTIDICIIGLSRDIGTAALVRTLGSSTRLMYFQQMQFGIDKRDLFHRWAYAKLDRWVTLTDAMRQAVLRHTTVHDSKIAVIPFGADLSRFDRRRFRKARQQKLLGIPLRKKVVAVIGRLDPQKGQQHFLMAIPEVLRRQPDAYFLIVGDETKGEEGFRSELNGLVDRFALHKHVHFLPFTRNMPELLSALDLVVMPSASETFGYLAVEAMAMGVPVVGTNAGGLPEIIKDGETGILFSPGDVNALARGIADSLRNRKLYRKMAENGVSRARKLFDFDRNVSQLEAVFRAMT